MTATPPAGATDLGDLGDLGDTATAREITQQPGVWQEVARIVEASRADLQPFLDPLLDRRDLRIVLSGAGTSAFVGEILAPALTRALRRRVDHVPTTDIVSVPQAVFGEDVPTLLVSFARSGESPESVAATRLADRCLREVHHLIVTCNGAGELARTHADAERSRVLLMPQDANDAGFAMTSSFSSMLLATWLVLAEPPDPTGLVDRLARAAGAVLAGSGSLAGLAARGYDRVVYLGSGPLAGLARESALKLLELTAGRVVGHHDTPLGFRHGPKSFLSDRTLVVVYVSNDAYTRRYDSDIATEVAAAVGPANLVVVAAGTWSALGYDVRTVEGVDDVDDALASLPFVVVAQTLGLHFSLAAGLEPDNPFPGGEVNRVVQGVTVHQLPD